MSRNADAAVGMMDTAYFVGRGELLDFFNNLLDLQLTKIEQTASGAVACQLTEYIFPRSIPMSRVNWEARSDYEFVGNYKLLQAAFTKNRVQRHVDVDKLIRAKYQDNLEFCQWLKAFFDQSGVIREDYDALAVRARGKGGNRYNEFLNKTASKHGSKPLPAARRPTRPAPPSTSPKRAPARPTVRSGAPTSTTTSTARRVASPKKPVAAKEDSNLVAENAALTKKNEELTAKANDLETASIELEKATIELEKERDFYFSKLQSIEVMLQIKQEKSWEETDMKPFMDSIFKILYATMDDDVVVNDDGEVLTPGDELNGSADPFDEGAVAIKPVVSDPMDEFEEGPEAATRNLNNIVDEDDDDALFAEEY